MTDKADRIYNVNVKRLALLTLPSWLRRPLVGALIYAGVSPLGRLLWDLRAYRSVTRYRLRHNGQVGKLRGVLNDEFDPELRRIDIEECDSMGSREAASMCRREVGRWVMVPRRGAGAVIIHREGFSGTSGYDFWVTVPEALHASLNEDRLRTIVDMYKLASKRYAITYK